MGWVQMSKRDLQRVEVLTEVLADEGVGRRRPEYQSEADRTAAGQISGWRRRGSDS